MSGSSSSNQGGGHRGGSEGQAGSWLEAEFPVIAGLPEVESILPDLDGGHEASPKLKARLSPEIAMLMEDAARRVRQAHPRADTEPPEPSPVLLPPDAVALVDELLGQDEELPAAPGTGAGTTTGTGTGAGAATDSRMDTPTAQLPPDALEGEQLASGSDASEITTAARALATTEPPADEQTALLPPELRSTPPGRATSVPPRETDLGLDTAWGPGSSRYHQQADPLRALGMAIAHRATGSLAIEAVGSEAAPAEPDASLRRILLRDGDLVAAASERPGERLIDFLMVRGDISAEMGAARAHRLPRAGRHAAAALIAQGLLGKDELWPVLRAHCEWIIGQAVREAPARCELEREPPEALRDEPNVFGGAAGVEIFVEIVRRTVGPDEAVERLGGPEAALTKGDHGALLAESALSAEEQDVVRAAQDATVGQVLGAGGRDFAPVLYALVLLETLGAGPRDPGPAAPTERPPSELDTQAVRQRVRARLELVHEADYFTLLGLSPNATSHEIRQAYLTLRRAFEPHRLLSPATADLAEDVALIVEVLEETYEVLRDAHRRERYREALESRPG